MKVFPASRCFNEETGTGLKPALGLAQKVSSAVACRLYWKQAKSTFLQDNLPKTSGYILGTLQSLTDRFVDLAYDIAPEGVSRSVVSLSRVLKAAVYAVLLNE